MRLEEICRCLAWTGKLDEGVILSAIIGTCYEAQAWREAGKGAISPPLGRAGSGIFDPPWERDGE